MMGLVGKELPAPELPLDGLGPGGVLAVAVYGLILLVGMGVNFRWLREWRQGRLRGEAVWVPCPVGRALKGHDLGILVLVLFALLSGSMALMTGDENPDMARMMVVQSVSFHWAVVVFALLYFRLQRRTGAGLLGLDRSRFRSDLRLGVVGYLGMMPIVFLYMVLYRWLLVGLGVEVEMQDVAEVINEESSPLLRIYFYFLGVLLAPVAEEILFRGLAFPLLARRMGMVGGVIVISLVFAAIHFHIPSLVPLFAVSVCLCMGYACTGSLVVPMVMHVLFNGWHLLVMSLAMP